VNNPVQSLWIGEHLSTLERLSIQSFLDHGHEYHLYAYQDFPDLPAGAMVRDANDILSAEQIFQYRERKSYAAFSNVFRYKLLLERGGLWADMDVVSLRTLDLSEEYAFASECVEWRDMPAPQTVVSSCLLKAPPGSPAMALALRICMAKDWATLRWGEIGPKLVAEVIEVQGLQRFVQPSAAFCPIPYAEWRRFIDPQPPALPAQAYAVHFWNEMWRFAAQDKDADYPIACLYECLKRRHLRRTDTDSGAACDDGVVSPGDTHE
jgi:Glycosyltransferase sugar-binding region containing DXD motif/Alpha 1,4-glycosyltransferase conserved region